MLEEENNQPKEEQAQEAAPAAPVKEAEAAFHSIQAMTPDEIKALPRADAYITHQKRYSRQSEVRSDVYYADIAFDSRAIYHVPLSVVQYGLICTATGKEYVPDQFREQAPVRIVKNHYKDRVFYVIDVYLCDDVRVSGVADKDFALLLEKRLAMGQVDAKFEPIERTASEKDAFFQDPSAKEEPEGGAN